MKYHGVVFDKDGTLLDFNRTWLPIYRYAVREFADGDAVLAEQLLVQHGFDAQRNQFQGGSLLAAGNNRQIADEWARQLGKPEQIETISLRLNEIFHERGAIEATPVANLASTLRRLKAAGLKLGVATADSHQGILDTLQSFNVLQEFDFLAGYDSGHGVKPDAGMVQAFCQQLSLQSDAVVVVGDNCHDIEMGRNANAGLCVGVLTGTSNRAELEATADIVLDDISALPDYL